MRLSSNWSVTLSVLKLTAAQAGCYDEELVALRERVACMAEELASARQAAPSRLQHSPPQQPEAPRTPPETEDADIEVCLVSPHHRLA